MPPPRIDHVLFSGCHLEFSVAVAAGGATGVPKRVTVKRFTDEPDSAALFIGTTADGAIADVSDTEIGVFIGADRVREWPITVLCYDVQGDTSDGNSYSIVRGRITMRQRPTRAHKQGNEARLNVTLAPTTLAATASNPISASLNATLAPTTLDATAGVLVNTGNLNATLAPTTLAASVSNPIGASLSATLAPTTLAATALTGFSLDSMPAPAGLWCVGARLRSSYTGALLRVKRADNNAQVDIPYNATTGLADLAALTAHCSSPATNGYIVTAYDQSGNGRHLTASGSPKVYDSATGPVLVNGTLAVLFDGIGYLDRTDSCGLSGATALSTGCVWKSSGSGTQSMLVGGDTTGTRLLQINTSLTTIALAIIGANRIFTTPDVSVGTNNFVARIAAGAGIGTATLRRNGVQLSQSSVTSGSSTITLGTLHTRWGETIVGPSGACGLWGANLSDTEAAVWDAMSSALYGT